MANAAYGLFKNALGQAQINLLTDNIKVVLVDTGAYAVNLSTHEFLSDIPSGARIATSGNLANKTLTLGVFNADDITLAAVAGTTVEAVVLYVDTGVEATSRLILYLDTAPGLVLTPVGEDVIASWSVSGIFAI